MSRHQKSAKQPSLVDVRTKGQVWTPRWVADGMATYLQAVLPGDVLDPAIGPGSLLAAIRDQVKQELCVTAFEIDSDVLSSNHSESEYPARDIASMHLTDFISYPIEPTADAVIANPPYLRHHSMSTELKHRCQEIVREVLNIKIDARAGLHVYFLVKALGHLKPGGRLSFLLPADTFEGVFASRLWTAIADNYSIDGILTFDSSVPAFPGVDTNAVVVFISRSSRTGHTFWMKWNGSSAVTLASELRDVFVNAKTESLGGLSVQIVDTDDAILRGLSRDPLTPNVDGEPFTSFASVVRGIATGDNDFFLMTKSRIQELKLAERYFVRTISRVRDAQSERLTLDDLDKLDQAGRPTFLLSLSKGDEISGNLKAYLQQGIDKGLPDRALLKARANWFVMEKRKPAPILFCYLGRRNQRFILVDCELQPTTGFLCVYPSIGVDVTRLHRALNHPSTIEQLERVGKSYGDGAIKVEPGGLRNLIIPRTATFDAGL